MILNTPYACWKSEPLCESLSWEASIHFGYSQAQSDLLPHCPLPSCKLQSYMSLKASGLIDTIKRVWSVDQKGLALVDRLKWKALMQSLTELYTLKDPTIKFVHRWSKCSKKWRKWIFDAMDIWVCLNVVDTWRLMVHSNDSGPDKLSNCEQGLQCRDLCRSLAISLWSLWQGVIQKVRGLQTARLRLQHPSKLTTLLSPKYFEKAAAALKSRLQFLETCWRRGQIV